MDVYIFIYRYMNGTYHRPKVGVNNFGNVVSNVSSSLDFVYLIGLNVHDIVLFDDGTDELKDSGAIILPRHYTIFVGTKDDELMFKPYEFDKYRIVVTTYKDIIISIDSIG